jgi:HEAT repeat protein
MQNRTFVPIAAILLLGAAPPGAQTPAERGWALLEQAIQDPKEESRASAAHALGLLVNHERALQLAERALKDQSPEVRAAAATTLGQIGLPAAIPSLKAAIQDPATEVVFSAAAALYALKDPGAYSVYYAVLAGERKTGEPLLQSQLDMLKDPQALAKIGFEAGMGLVPFGGLGYKAFRKIKQDNVSPVRAAAAQRLASDPDPRSGEALAKAASDKEWLVRTAVASAIARRGDPKLIPAVIPLLDDQQDTVRFNAAAAVIRLSK